MTKHHPWVWLFIGILNLLSPWGCAQGEDAAAPVVEQQDRRGEFDAAVEAMNAARREGPVDVALLEQAVLHLPEGYAFVPNPAATQFMQAIGNRVSESFIGLILPADEKGNWIVVASFDKSGYIRDDDAKDWKVEEMLDSLKQGTEEMNRTRASRGIPELEVTGWAEQPAYDASSHRLVWSLAVRHKSAAEDEEQSVNYNTYALGREGYLSLNLVTSLKEVASRQPVMQALLASLEFNEGKRYDDVDVSTDHMAEYGLAALVGGIAAKKLGLLAMAAVFVAKFGKIIGISALTLFGLFGKRLLKKKGGGNDSMEA